MSKWLVLIIVLLGLSGCKDESGEAYTMSIQNGLDYLAAEDYNRAEGYFELSGNSLIFSFQKLSKLFGTGLTP